MNERQQRALTRAVELDDDLPLNQCPGCLQNIEGWERHEAHFVAGRRLSSTAMWYRERHEIRWPFTDKAITSTCRWTLDYLVARRFRRAYIAKHFRMAS